MTDEPVSISAASLQASTDAAWEPVVDKFWKVLMSDIDNAKSTGFYSTFFTLSIFNSRVKGGASHPTGDMLVDDTFMDYLWTRLLDRLKGSEIRIKHANEKEEVGAIFFYWGTAVQIGMTAREFICLRVL